MTIHTTDTRALVAEFGLDLHPAMSTSIGLEEVVNHQFSIITVRNVYSAPAVISRFGNTSRVYND